MDNIGEAYADELMEGQDLSEHAGIEKGGATVWHQRISVEAYMWVLVVGSLAVLWFLGGSFRKVLS